MDEISFTRQLCGWLDPFRLAWIAQQYAENPRQLESRVTVTHEAKNFTRAGDVGIDRLIRIFVNNFKLPGEVFPLLSSVVPIHDTAYKRMIGLRFTGEITFENSESFTSTNTIASFTGPAIEIYSMAGPLNFLIRFVDQVADTWLQYPRDKAFYEQSFHTELLTYIEACVAKSLGFDMSVAWTSGKQGINFYPLGGIATMVGSPPFNRQSVTSCWAEARGGRTVPEPRPVVTHSSEVLFDEKQDGVILRDEVEVTKPWNNIGRFRNECSPLSGIEMPRRREDGKLYVDTQYGRAFDFILTESSAVYGYTEDLAHIKEGYELGYLRVPYRCVPRILVRSRAEVETVIESIRVQAGGFVENRILLRGQTCEYYLGRSTAALNALYGDPHALEPSLHASAVRRKDCPLEVILPQWCFLIRCYQLAFHVKLINELETIQLKQLQPKLEADRRRLELSLDNQVFALSLAQHYGLPSMGLDLTDQVETALFFSLQEFAPVSGRRIQAVPSSRESVLYVFAFPERFCIEHARARPEVFPRGRPDAQDAWFAHMGWGYRRNQCAEYLIAALYLEPSGDFGPLPLPQDLFPANIQDQFGNMLEAVLDNRSVSTELLEYLEKLYWVVN